ncbi:MAG: SBBP repeat-containing protein [Candidatus Helarchaeota archaeon]|nr:SBBP repeat-containing protein [Candidatus Helarchaeota archaeon]
MTQKLPEKNNILNPPDMLHVQDVAPPVSYEWSRIWRYNQETIGKDVAVDDNNNIYLAGYTTNTTPGASDAFLLKYDSFGNLLWNRTWGGNESEWAYGVAVNNNDGIFIAGYTWSFGLGYSDAFLVKYDPSGNQLWNRTWGTSNWEFCYAVAIDNSNVYIAGRYDNVSNYGLFLVKYDTNGTQIWNQTYPCLSTEYVNDIAVDSTNIYLTGRHRPGNSTDILLMKFDVSGNQLWNRTWSSPEYEQGHSVVIDGNYVYLTGITENYSISIDAILVKYDSFGNKVWERIWGGGGIDYANSVGVDNNHNVFIAGTTDSFDIGFYNVFLVKYNASGNRLWNLTWGEYVPREECNVLTIYGNDTFYLAGYNYSSGGIDDRDSLLIKLVSHPPNTPTLDPISPILNHHGMIDLNWNEINTATGYYVYRDTSNITSVAGLTPIARISTSQYQDRVSINNTYYYAIMAENPEGNSSISNCESAVVEIYLLNSAPILNPISPNPDYDRTVKLTWNNVNGVYAYYIYRDTSPITSLTGLASVASTSTNYYYDTITKNGTYYYVVVAGNAAGNSSRSNCESVMVIILLPQLEWERRWGKGDNDEGTGVAIDTNNDVYMTGSTNSFGDGSSDILLVKYDSLGNQLWNRTWRGASSDYSYDIIVDNDNSICITGSTTSASNNLDVLLLKYDSGGNLLLNKTWGTSYDDYGYGIAVDGNNNIYIAATTGIIGPFQEGNPDAILLKFGPVGNFLWNRTRGGPTIGKGESVAVDYDDNIYLAGYLNNTFDETQSNLLAKYDPTGNLLWNRTCYGSGKSIAIDNSNNVYFAGANFDNRSIYKYDSDGTLIWNKTIHTPGIFWSVHEIEVVNVTIYLTCMVGVGVPPPSYLQTFDLAGNPLWSFYWSGIYGRFTSGIAIDTNNNSYIVGDDQNIFSMSSSDILLVKVDSAGNQSWNLTWGYSGDVHDGFLGISLDNDNHVNLAGYTNSMGAGDYDALLVQYDIWGNQLWNCTWGGSLEDRGSDVTIDSNQNIYLTGNTRSFGSGNFDSFIVKYNVAGTQIWNRTWGGVNDDFFYGVMVDQENHSYLVGSTDGKALLVKYDALGNQLWNHTWNSSGNSCGKDVTIDYENNIYLGGFTEESVLLVKYDTLGNQLWNRTWNSSVKSRADNIATDGSHVYLVGNTDTGCAFLLKYDSFGNQLWNKIWNHTITTFQFSGIAVDKKNNSFIIGIETPFPFSRTTLLIKCDSDGNQLWDQNWSGNWITIDGNDIAIDENDGIFLTGISYNMFNFDSHLAKFRDVRPENIELITVKTKLGSDTIRQDELLIIELNITRIIELPFNITFIISSKNFQEYRQSFILNNDSNTVRIELRYYPDNFFDHGNKHLQIQFYCNGSFIQSLDISIQIKLSLNKCILISILIAVGAITTTGVTYEIRKVRNKKKVVLTYLKSAKSTKIPISVLAVMTELGTQEVLKILTDLLMKNQITGVIRDDVFCRISKKDRLPSIKEKKESLYGLDTTISKQINLINTSLDDIEFLFNNGDINLETFELTKSELLSDRRKLKIQLDLLSKIVTIIPPAIYNEINQLDISDEQKILILKEIAAFPSEKAQLILEEYKKLLDYKST